jgi:hypothetical protein
MPSLINKNLTMSLRIFNTLLVTSLLTIASFSYAANGSNPEVQVDNGPLIPSTCSDITNCNFDQIFGFDGATDSLMGRLINFAVFKLAIPLTTIAIVYAGIVIVSNPASSSKREEGKRILYMAVWGLVITLSAYLIIKTIVNLLDSGAYKISL